MNPSIPLRCPCGQCIAITHESVRDHWVTIHNRDYEPVLRAELRCRELLAAGGDSSCGTSVRSRSEFDAETQRIIDRSGSLLQCPHCQRLLWQQPGEPGCRSFCPEPGPPAVPG